MLAGYEAMLLFFLSSALFLDFLSFFLVLVQQIALPGASSFTVNKESLGRKDFLIHVAVRSEGQVLAGNKGHLVYYDCYLSTPLIYEHFDLILNLN